MRILKVLGDIRSYQYDNGDIVKFDDVKEYVKNKKKQVNKTTKKNKNKKNNKGNAKIEPSEGSYV